MIEVICLGAIALVSALGWRRERSARGAAESAKSHAEGATAARLADVEQGAAAQMRHAESTIEALREELAYAKAESRAHRAALDASPIPLWRRGPDGAVVWSNDAARKLAAQAGSFEDRDLAARARRLGGRHGESRTLVIEGERRVFDLVEEVPADRPACGWASDVTALFAAQEELDRHLDQQAEILSRLACGIEIYGPDQRLLYFNPAFADMAKLESSWLAHGPRLHMVLEAMREARTLPLTSDYQAFREERLALFQSVTSVERDVLYLADGAAWRMTVAPHANGGLIFIYEDASDALGLERDVNILLDVRRETIDHLMEAVAVFGPDGRLKLSNPAFQTLWRLLPITLAHNPHIRDVAADAAACLDDDRQDAFQTWMTDRVFECAAASAVWVLSDGRTIEHRASPLPDGALMFACLDVTDTMRARRELSDRAEAAALADQLKSEFVANLSREARAPADAIAGFADVLADQAFGPLSVEQQRCAGSIAESANRLLALLDDVDDLAQLADGRLALVRRPTPLGALFAELQLAIRERAERAGVAVSVGPGEAAISLDADPARLRQAMLNLLEHAVRHTPTGGRILLQAAIEDGAVAVTLSDFAWGPDAGDPVFDAADGAPYLSGAVARGGEPLPLFDGLDEVEPVDADDEDETAALATALRLRLATRLIEAHGGVITARRRSTGLGTVECRLPLAQDEWRPEPKSEAVA